MGIRSKVAMLPAALRSELDRLIVERAFSGYQALAEWLQAQGYQIADDSVQRYGAKLRRQLAALDLARHVAEGFAAAGKGAADTAEALTAVTVQLIQQQVISTLLHAAQPGLSNQTETTAATSGGGTHDSDHSAEAGRGPARRSANVLCDGEAKPLDLRDLLRLTRITVDLSRITQQRQRAEPTTLRQCHDAPTPDQTATNRESNALSEEAYRAVRNALRNDPPLAPAEAESLIEPIESVSVTQEAKQSAPESIPPQLTAPDRTYPHPGGVADSGQRCHQPGLAVTFDPNAFDSQDSACPQDVEQAEVA
jgi:Protein of unknown function (DUF3486)